MYLIINKFIKNKYKIIKRITQSIFNKIKSYTKDEPDIENQIEMIYRVDQAVNNISLKSNRWSKNPKEDNPKPKKIHSIPYYKIFSHNSNKLIFKKVENLPKNMKKALFYSNFFKIIKNTRYYKNPIKVTKLYYKNILKFKNNYNSNLLSKIHIDSINITEKIDNFSNVMDSSLSRTEENDNLIDSILKQYNDKLNNLRKK